MTTSEKPGLGYLKGIMASSGGNDARPAANNRSVKWIDGLRGLASFSVITSHLARAFDYNLFHPADSEQAAIRLFQLPFFRLWPQGRIGVAIFALLTGFVCGIKPIKQIRAGDRQGALTTISKGAFKRPMRLMIPGTVATLIAFMVCQLGLFSVGAKIDSDWLRDATPQVAGSLWSEIRRLQFQIRGTWTTGHNDYDDHQWTLLPLLKSSLYAYLGILVTVFLSFRYRMITYMAVFMFFWQDGRPDTETFFCQAYWGLLLSDLTQHKPFQDWVQKRSMTRQIGAHILIWGGLFIGSFPPDHEDWKTWSRMIKPFAFFFPSGSYLPKRYTALGLEMTSMGIVLSNSARGFLCTRPLQFLGRYSFAVYLTHGTLFKTLLIWMIYGVSGYQEKNDKGELMWIKRCSTGWFYFWVPIWLVVVYSGAWAWTTYVDTWAEKVSQWVMKKCFEDTSGEKPPSHQGTNGTLPK